MTHQAQSAKALPASEKADIIRKVNRLEPACKFNPDDTIAEYYDTAFYPGARLIRLCKSQPNAAPLWYVSLPEETVVLDGSVANIHYINAAAPLRLDEATVEDYLRFRLHFSGGGHIDEARFEERNGSWQAKARVIEKTGIYETTLIISARGEVTELQKERLSDTANPAKEFTL